MAKVILSLDGLVLKELTLTKERTTIGRRSHSDIHIDNLAVSGDHAAIVSVVEDYFLEDLGSTNGTLVNGKPIKRHLLKSNDVIELGKFKLEFIGRSAVPAKDAAEYEKTMVYRPSAARTPSEPAGAVVHSPAEPPPVRGAAAAMASAIAGHASPAFSEVAGVRPSQPPVDPPIRSVAPAATRSATPAASPAPRPSIASGAAPIVGAATAPPVAQKGSEAWGAIRIVSGAGAGRERALTKPVTTLGKPGVQVAMLTRRPQGYYLTHVEGARHPQVNGQTIGTEPFPLNDHDIIELTGLRVEFLLRRSQGTSSARNVWIGLAVVVIVVVGFLFWKLRR